MFLLTLLLALFSVNVSAQHKLLSVESLFVKPTFGYAQLNSLGNKIAVYGYEKGDLRIKLLDLHQGDEQLIFAAKKNENVHVKTLFWLDDNIFYFETRHKNNTANQFNKWLVEMNNLTQDFSLRRINSNGYVIDPLPNEAKKLWYATYKGRRSKLKIYKTDYHALLRDNFSNEVEFESTLTDANDYKTDANHQIRFSHTYDEEKDEVTYRYLDADKKWQSLKTLDPLENEFTPIGFLKNGKLAVITNLNSDLKSVYEFDVNTQQLGKVLYQHPNYDIESAQLDEKGSSVLSASYFEQGKWQTEYFDEKFHYYKKLIQQTFADQQFYFMSHNQARDRFIFKVFSSDQVGQIYFFDAQTKQAMYLGSENNYIQNVKFSPTKTIKVETSDKQLIEAMLTRPQLEADNHVLLVMPHGGPVGVRDWKYFNPEVQYLVNRGYSVLQVNYRGSDGYGKKFLDEGRGEFGKTIERDINTAVKQVTSTSNYQHICAIGASYGGYSAVMLSILHPSVYQCVIARFGVFDLPLIFSDRNSKLDEKVTKRWARVVGKNDEKLLAHSPVYLSNKIQNPVLITAGRLDKQASFEHSNRLKYVLKMHKADVESVYYKWSGHGHSQLLAQQHELAYIDDFIRRKLNLSPPIGEYSSDIQAREALLIKAGLADPDLVFIPKNRAP